jgi:threonine dehydratase
MCGVSEDASPVAAKDVVAAAAAIGNRLHRTPILSSATLGEAFGGGAYLKAELFQRTGSFKPRGALTKLASLDVEEKRRGVISISAGNHAAGLAFACALEDVDCLVVMWASASEQKVAATRGYGAAVDLEAESPGDAFDRLEELREATGRTLVHPYDDPIVIAGQGTVGLEIVEDRPDVDTVVVPTGGGGLVAGIATAVKAARPDARVVAVEPEGSAALGAALETGERVRIAPTSIADALNAPFAGEHPLAVARALDVEHVTVSEAEIEAGFRFLYERAKLAAEPGGAAAVAALLVGRVPDIEGRTVVCVISGGNVAAQTASDILGKR